MTMPTQTEKPLITQRQAKNTLSAKKLKKPTGKLTLNVPYTSEYRPIIREQENEEIKSQLSHLPRIIAPKEQIPWSLVKDIPKAERKAFRQKHQHKLPRNEEIRNNLILGLNKVTVGLEKNELEIVLLTSDINPKLMQLHILELCVIKNIPVLIVDDLRTCLLDTLGISSTCLGVRVESDVNILQSLVHLVTTIWSKYPPPDDYLFNNASIVFDDSTAVVNMVEDEEVVTQPESQNFHLYRANNKSRAFTPTGFKRSIGDAFKVDYWRFAKAEPSEAYRGLCVTKITSTGRKIVNRKYKHGKNNKSKHLMNHPLKRRAKVKK